MSELGRARTTWLGEGQARGSVGRKKVRNAAWNQFQHDHIKKGWPMTWMRQEYYNREKNEKKGFELVF